MTVLTFRPIDVWPEGWKDPGRRRKTSPFRASYSSTLELLDRELKELGTSDAFMQVDAEPGQVRLDGQLRSGAKVGHPGVILTIDTKSHGVLVYPCDAFTPAYWRDGAGWQVNLRAIALGLEALRKVERYGIADRGQQYAGFGALPPATPMGAAMTVEDAFCVLAEFDDSLCDHTGAEAVRSAYRIAAKTAHPDHGGDPETFRLITEARDVLLNA